jgi:hypothetical protein
LRPSLLVEFIAISTLCLLPVAASADYPSRPAAVHLYYEDGRLVDYSLGKHGGDLAVLLPSGQRDLVYIAYPNKINGHHYLCQTLPRVGEEKPAAILCSERPPNIVVGRTHVRVTYWWGTYLGQRAKISDEISTL